MRHTHGHTGNRRSHHALKGIATAKDTKSGMLILPHRLDEATGTYRGRQIVPLKEKKAKRIEKPSGTHHEHVHPTPSAGGPEHEGSKGIMGKLVSGAKAKARSGMGGGA